MKYVLLLCFILAPVYACLPAPASARPQSAEDETRISAEALLEKIKKGEPVLILDVRASGQYTSSATRVKDDIRIDKDEDLETKMKDVPHDRPIVAYCT